METTRSAALLRMARSILARRAEGTEEGAEGGFTLIELMVVLLIMAILLAIAIPTFLGVKGGAQNRAAQSDLTNAITSAKAYYTNIGNYGSAASLVATLTNTEPEMSFATGAVTQPGHNVSVYVTPDGYITILAEQAANQTCWYVEDNEESAAGNDGVTGVNTVLGITYASSNGTTAANCNAAVTAVPASTWKGTYPAS